MFFGRLRRFTWRRIIFLSSAAGLFFIFVFSLLPITSPLPSYTGPYEVGILDLETEVQKRVIHDAILKSTGEKAFELNTLAVTLYYPSSLPVDSRRSRTWARHWLPQPVSLIGEGYARLAGVKVLSPVFTLALKLLGSSIVIPGVLDAPVLFGAEKVLSEDGGSDNFGKMMSAAEQEHSELKRDEGFGTLPCVVFTHGMAGMSQSYAHYLGSLASHGYMVAAVEHRDGSGPGTIIHYPNGKERKVWHLKLKDLDSNPPMTAEDLHTAQLNFREAEMSETINLFTQLHAGDTPVVNLKPGQDTKALHGFTSRLNLSAVTIAGHSYGATGAMQALAPHNPNFLTTTTINGGIALDPGKSSGPLNKNINVPLLVMQSGAWTATKSQFYNQGWHFDVVRKIVQNVQYGWFITLTGTAHPSCTDAPLIVPWIMRLVTGTTLDARVALREYIDASVGFLEYLQTGERKGVLASEVTTVTEGEGLREVVEGPHGGEWEVHVVPGGD
jgi:platelet-activating factor acetylhydrolase